MDLAHGIWIVEAKSIEFLGRQLTNGVDFLLLIVGNLLGPLLRMSIGSGTTIICGAKALDPPWPSGFLPQAR